eukprot:1149208-Pelagomonas_calceolata.AAC.5
MLNFDNISTDAASIASVHSRQPCCQVMSHGIKLLKGKVYLTMVTNWGDEEQHIKSPLISWESTPCPASAAGLWLQDGTHQWQPSALSSSALSAAEPAFHKQWSCQHPACSSSNVDEAC